jgi:hypothetical protein
MRKATCIESRRSTERKPVDAFPLEDRIGEVRHALAEVHAVASGAVALSGLARLSRPGVDRLNHLIAILADNLGEAIDLVDALDRDACAARKDA